MRFHVISDNGTTLTMQSQKNVVLGTAWHAGENNNTSGPDTIVPALETATSGWINVNTLNTTYASTTAECDSSFNCTTGYSDYTTGTANKARLISFTESTVIGECLPYISIEKANAGTCVKWMTNYLNRHERYNNFYYDISNGNDGYWTSNSAKTNGDLSSWRVYILGDVGGNITSSITNGARAVVEVNK